MPGVLNKVIRGGFAPRSNPLPFYILNFAGFYLAILTFTGKYEKRVLNFAIQGLSTLLSFF